MGYTNANVALYGPIADQAAISNGVDPAIFRSLIMSESSFNPNAINPTVLPDGTQASGIAQFRPSTANSLGIDPFNPTQALNGAAQYLSGLIQKYGLLGGIAAYKGNPTNPTALSQAKSVIDNAGNMDSSLLASVMPTTASAPASGAGSPANSTNPNLFSSFQTGGSTSSGNTKSLWQYTSDDWKNLIQNSMWGFLFGFFGVVLIILSIYMVVRNSDAAGAATKTVGALLE